MSKRNSVLGLDFARAALNGMFDAERQLSASAHALPIAAILRRVPLGVLDDAIVCALKELGRAWPRAASQSMLVRMAMRGAS